MRGPRNPDPPVISNAELFLVLAAMAACALDDLYYLRHEPGMTEFVVIDYVKKTAIFFICVLPPSLRLVSKQAFATPSVPWNGAGWFNPHVLIVTAAFFLCDQMIYWFAGFLDQRLGVQQLFFFPSYQDNIIKYLDRAFGLLWNSVAEELFFRAILIAALFRFVPHLGTRILIAGILFGAIHWSQGWVAIAAITALGWMLGYLYCLTRSIVPGIVIHTLHNLISFTP